MHRLRLAHLFAPVLVAIVAASGLLVAVTPAGAQSSPRPAEHFRLATFNVLGAVHTDGRHARRGFARSSVRLPGVVRILRSSGIDLVGFQELNDQQLRRFRHSTDNWRAFTGRRGDTDNSIAWRRDRFAFVRGWTIPVPYFHGQRRPMPVVELRSKETHRPVYVMNTHNPADTRGRAGHWRARAVRIERQVTTRLSRRHPRASVFMTGDMNDRAAFLCPFTSNGVMHSFLGKARRHGRCITRHYPGVDWILGNHHVRFSRTRIDRSRLVRRTTDHPVVSVRARLRG